MEKLPPELGGFSGRQRELLEAIFARGGATARQVHQDLADPPASVHGLKTLLNRMTARGVLTKRPSGRHREVLYVPATTSAELRRRSFLLVARTHFAGSTSRAVRALEKLAEATNGNLVG